MPSRTENGLQWAVNVDTAKRESGEKKLKISSPLAAFPLSLPITPPSFPGAVGLLWLSSGTLS